MSPFDLSKYEPVEDRLRAFWEEHPNGRIITEVVKAGDGEFIVRAAISWSSSAWQNAPDPTVVTGLAHEREGSSTVNKTSALENCETSAIGRALANLGYAPKGARPSREEMSKASRRTSDSATPSHPKVAQDGSSVDTLPVDNSPSVAESATSAPAVIGSAGTDESGSGVAADGEAAAAPDPGQPKSKCLHLKGSKPRKMSSGRMREVCLECGAVLEEAAS